MLNTDTDSSQLTINYEGGSLTMSIGNLKSLFGENYELVTSTPADISTSVSSHQRVRVIGGSASTVSAHSRDYKAWPTSQANGAAAGKKVLISWEGSGGQWTARITGSMADFASFLESNTSVVAVFRTSRGTKYGPFNSDKQ